MRLLPFLASCLVAAPLLGGAYIFLARHDTAEAAQEDSVVAPAPAAAAPGGFAIQQPFATGPLTTIQPGATPSPARPAAEASVRPGSATIQAPTPADVAAVPGEAKPLPATLFVLNSADANIQVLDPATREEVSRIPVLRETHHLVLTPNGKTLMVGDSGGNEMLLIDPVSGVLKSREKISNPYHMEFSPDGKYLVVTSLRRAQVDIYAFANDTLVLKSRLRVPSKPSHLAYRPDGKVVYVTLQGARGLMAIDLEKNEPLWTVDVGPEPAGVIWHNNRLLVGVMGADYIAVVDPEAKAVERTITIARGAHALFKSPSEGGPLYVTSRVDSRITTLDPRTLAVQQQWSLPGGPDCITFDPDGRLWVTLRWTGRVAVFDPETGNNEQFRVGRSPHGILLHQNIAQR